MLRGLGLCMIGAVAVLVLLRRRAISRRLTKARLFVARRLADREASATRAIETWEDEGGALRATGRST